MKVRYWLLGLMTACAPVVRAESTVVFTDPQLAVLGSYGDISPARPTVVAAGPAGDLYFGSSAGHVRHTDGTLNFQSIYGPMDGAITAITTSSGGQVFWGTIDGDVRRVDADLANNVYAYGNIGVPVTGIAVGAGNNVYFSSSDGRVRHTDFTLNFINAYGPMDTAVRSLAVNRQTGDVYFGTAGGDLRHTDANLNFQNLYSNIGAAVTAMAVSLTGDVYFGSADGIVRHTDADFNFIDAYTGLDAVVTSIAISADGTSVYFGDTNGYVRHTDANLNFVSPIFFAGMDHIITSLAVGPNDDVYIATAVVPEPASLSLLALTSMALLGRRRR